ncbi:SCO7613 C-terminal domain-containing membrane protein [Blastococcus sp. SYSU DS0617]
MQQPVATAPLPPLPYRARPPQVLLGVGAVLLVSAGAVVASAYGGAPARTLLLALAAVTAGFALRAARARLRSSEEVLAASATGLAVSASGVGGDALAGAGATAALAVGFLVLHRIAPTTATWPLASWIAAQLAVLRGLEGVPAGLRTHLFLGVALVGLGVALFGRRGVGRIALLTTAPWWVAGVASGIATAWTGPAVERYLSAALVVGAGLGLVLTRLRQVLEPLTGPPRAAPVLAGVVAGTAVAGACSVLGTAAVTLTGYAGVLLATLAAASLTGWRRGLFLPLALAAGVVMTAVSIGRLLADRQWTALSLLLLLTAVPTVWVAVRRPEDRPLSVPVTVGCLAGAVLLAVPDGVLSPTSAAIALTAVYAGAMAAGAGLDTSSRRATAVAAGGCAVAAVLLLLPRDRPLVLAAVLAAQGLCTLAWAGLTWRSQRRAGDAELSRGAWRVGAAQLVGAAWVLAAAADGGAIEAYSLPAALGLLLASGPGLLRGSTWAAWGPGLLVAAVPSTVLAVVASDGPRTVTVLLAAAGLLVAGGRRGLRAPLAVGAGSALAVAVGLAAQTLPWPVGTALVVGAVLLAVGARRERRPVAGFGVSLAELR